MRLLATVSYDGSNYAGYQIQPDQLTIQSVIESALTQIHKGQPIKITASGRTDAGVHAHGQTFHFDSELMIAEVNWKKAMNALLPDDIVIKNVEQVSDQFHARYSAKQKTYRYVILNSADPSPFQTKYSTYIHQPLHIESMNQACQYLIGEHDFTSFCAANSHVKGSKVRKIYQASCQKQDQYLIFTIRGNGFLYNMVRIIIGTLIEVGLGKRSPECIPEIIMSKDRKLAGKTAPAQGLYLDHVIY
ncbi:tRNA pseudouridine(38-40) synthase TruA [Amphibacillus sp. MSJ-3]|uniref:tRNA pseudouridine(38-40) synthase TruA n=1 Tax=Amphibacillus sp. MSJ-3 TaxID=2841505 RepID=UPI001C0F30FD|nr:tRNA pseudouridine(38-40) synthase TruA [Amphibacillus sp. MSJ-3]MBU5594645.1 tRNA pseudouridine(38-40) synthase TruA [Amphibacillus sp. MSJ-3]